MNAIEALLLTLVILIIANTRTRSSSSGRTPQRFLVLKLITLGGLLSALYLLFTTSLQVSAEGVIFDAIGSDLLSQSPLNLRIDNLSLFMAFIALILSICVTTFSFSYMKEDENLDLYYILLVAMTIGILGIFFSADFLTLFIFWELMSIPSYALVFFGKNRWEPIEATVKYTIMSIFGNALILLAMSFIYGMTGSLSYPDVITRLPAVSNTLWVSVTAILFITGFGVKASIFPLHTWLPDAHPAAPSPISALLSGIMISTGAYVIIRLMYTVFTSFFQQWTLYFAIISIFTMSVGNLLAYRQHDVKRLLAYSSVAHMGYIFSGISTGTSLGLEGAYFHILNHAFMKGLAFLCIGAYTFQSGVRDIDALTGIGRKMPITTICLSISLFALMGIPPFSGFISEVLLFQSNIAIGNGFVAGAILINSILGSIYYVQLLQRFLTKDTAQHLHRITDAPRRMLLPLVVMAIIVVSLTIFSGSILAFLQASLTPLIS